MAMLPTTDVILSQLFLGVKASGSLILYLNVQAPLIVLLWSATHAVGVLMFFPLTQCSIL